MTSATDRDCPMTEECPAYDRDGRVCLVHPGDCEFAPADGAPHALGAADSIARDDPRAGGSTAEG